MNSARALSMVASCSAALESKCAYTPLLLSWVAWASVPMLSPSRPSMVAKRTAVSRISRLVRSPSVRVRRAVFERKSVMP